MASTRIDTQDIRDLTIQTSDIADSQVTPGKAFLSASSVWSFQGGLSGSIQNTSAGLSYLVAGTNITVISASNGQITISASTGSTVSLDSAYDAGGSGAGRRIFIDAGPVSLETTSSVGLALSGTTIGIAIQSAFATSITAPGAGSNSERFGLNAAAAGTGAVAIGFGASASGERGAIAIGSGSQATIESGSIAIGAETVAHTGSIAIGYRAFAFTSGSIAIGINSHTSGVQGTAIGTQAIAASTSTTALGFNARAMSSNSTALGRNSFAADVNAVALGGDATASVHSTAIGRAASGTLSSVAIGFTTTAANAGVAVGFSAGANGGSSVALGYEANASRGRDIALGRNSFTTTFAQMVVGSEVYDINSVHIGNGVWSTAPISNVTITATSGTGTDIAGTSLTIAGGRSSGAARGGQLIFQTTPSGAAGSTANTSTTRLRIDASGSAFFTNGLWAENTLVVTGSARFLSGLSGSHTQLVNGTSFLIAGANVAIVSNSNGSVTISAADAIGFEDVISHEIITGANGVAASFTLSQVPTPSEHLHIYKNGLRMVSGSSFDYVLTGSDGRTVTFQAGQIPTTNSNIVADYLIRA